MTVSVEITVEQEASLVRLAELEGVSVAEVLTRTATLLATEEQGERELLRERIAQADRGEFLDDMEAERRLAVLFCR